MLKWSVRSRLRAAALLPQRVICTVAPTYMAEEPISGPEYAALMARIMRGKRATAAMAGQAP